MCVALGIGVLPAAASQPPVPAAAGPATSYYLALGDSMAAGFQPRGGKTTGYVGRVWQNLQKQITELQLRNIACPGETTDSLMTGRRSPCRYRAGSQLDAAVAFLTKQQGQVSFITINIGSNDLVNRCLRGSGLIKRSCAVAQRPRLKKRVTSIIEALTAAAPGVPIVGMTYHDPFLGLWGAVPHGQALARADQRAFAAFNAGLLRAYDDAGAGVADVAETFRIDDFAHTVLVPGRGRIPVNVAIACDWTWFCSPGFFGDPHPNRVGYRKVARTFDRTISGLLGT